MSNTMLLDMLSARAASQDNSAAMDMLARLRDGTAAPTLNTQELLAQLTQSNPMLAVFAQHLAQSSARNAGQRGEVIEAEAVEVASSEDESEEATPNEFADEIQQLQAQVAALSDEVTALRGRDQLLADALGACCLCWGDDPQCRACRGRGSPGYAKPNEALFGEFILPAMQMLRACRVGRGVVAPPTRSAMASPDSSIAATSHP